MDGRMVFEEFGHFPDIVYFLAHAHLYHSPSALPNIALIEINTNK